MNAESTAVLGVHPMHGAERGSAAKPLPVPGCWRGLGRKVACLPRGPPKRRCRCRRAHNQSAITSRSVGVAGYAGWAASRSEAEMAGAARTRAAWDASGDMGSRARCWFDRVSPVAAADAVARVAPRLARAWLLFEAGCGLLRGFRVRPTKRKARNLKGFRAFVVLWRVAMRADF